MMTEKNDEIVEIHSSLMMGVAREIQTRLNQKFFTDRKTIKKFIKSVKFITNLEHDLFTIIEY